MMTKRRPGEVRDAIFDALSLKPQGASLAEIQEEVVRRIGPAPASSVRSYLRLNTPEIFERTERAHYLVKENFSSSLSLDLFPPSQRKAPFVYNKAVLLHNDCLEWLQGCDPNSIHAVVTDPPYGLFEYSSEQQTKLRNGKGGVWRIPPAFDGAKKTCDHSTNFSTSGPDHLC
jgi:hypothetical protein